LNRMGSSEKHYRDLTHDRRTTRFARCGYRDRFDPFVLNRVPYLRNLYTGLFSSFLSGIPHISLLDIGCGTGVYFDTLASHADSIVAIDESGDMAAIADEYCRQNGLTTIHLGVGSAECVPCKSGTFDIVIAMDLLHHVSDLEKTLAEVDRVLKPGGHFFVFEPNICNPLMFLAHLVPAEERLALHRNRPRTLQRLLETRFDPVRWAGVCAMITQLDGIKSFVLRTYVNACKVVGVKRLYPRQAFLCRKR